MDRKTKSAMRKIVKVIKLFEEKVILFLEDENVQFDELGNPVLDKNEIEIKMAIMTPKTTINTNETLRDIFISKKKEAYYILNKNNNFVINENMRLIYKDTVYKIIKIEENYGIFLRMELNIDDKRN